MTHLRATPAKLRDGTWGARVLGVPPVGTIVEVRTSAGKTWDARIVAIIRAGHGPDDPTLVATESVIPRPVRAAQDDVALAERGLIRVSGPRGSYVRQMDRQDHFDNL